MTEKPLFRRPAIFNQFPELIAAESTRHGGVSEAPYHSLNLGGSTTDNPENVSENNLRFFSGLGINIADTAKSHQVHGAEILHVAQPGRYEGYDALITEKTGIHLAVTIADCTPILIYDPVKKAAAAIHAGWRGTVQNIVSKTMEAMKVKFGTEPGDCFAYIGTCIDGCSFEVGEEVALHFESAHKHWDEKKQKYFVDLKKANKDQLLSSGLKQEHVQVSDFSTVLNNEDYFSYRLENGLTGRMLATIGINE